jgi:hypothetical protein
VALHHVLKINKVLLKNNYSCLTFNVCGWALKRKHKQEKEDDFKEFGLSQLNLAG